VLQGLDVRDHLGLDERLTASRIISCSSDHSITIVLRCPYIRGSGRSEAIRGRPTVEACDCSADRSRPPTSVGGEAFFTALVDRFYEGVATDPLLRPMYPRTSPSRGTTWPCSSSSTGVARPLRRGARPPPPADAPRPLHHRPAQSAAWLRHMTDAVDASGLGPGDREELLDYLGMAAHNLINSTG